MEGSSAIKGAAGHMHMATRTGFKAQQSEGKKPATEKYILSDPIYIKFYNRQK